MVSGFILSYEENEASSSGTPQGLNDSNLGRGGYAEHEERGRIELTTALPVLSTGL